MKKIKKTIAVISGFIVGLLVKFGLYNGVKAVALYGVPEPIRNNTINYRVTTIRSFSCINNITNTIIISIGNL